MSLSLLTLIGPAHPAAVLAENKYIEREREGGRGSDIFPEVKEKDRSNVVAGGDGNPLWIQGDL